jgi:hypothetical protein
MSKKEFVDRLYDRIYSIEIIDDAYGEVTRSGDPSDKWDRDDTHTSHNVQGFKAKLEKEGGYFDLTVPYEPEFDETYYLLYVVYSTGDSFGHDAGSGLEAIGLYKKDELDVAKDNERRIEKHYRSKDPDFNVELITSSGKKFQQHTPWVGYFESLDYTEIADVRRQK